MKIESFFERVVDKNQPQPIAPIGFAATLAQYPPQPKVVILLCTKQGERFLPAQLESFTTQTHTNWEVWASDDASDDQTKKILLAFQKENKSNRIFVMDGPDKGFCKNFLSLACNPDVSADFYAYSDQDDIWMHDKLDRAVNWLQSVPSKLPAVYCSRTELIDAQGKHIGFSSQFKKTTDFKNALVQCVAGANTMVFNQAAKNLLASAGMNVLTFSHDWWTYQLVTGSGGLVHYDNHPSIQYRQHENNLVGTNITWKAKWKRVVFLLKGHFREMNELNIHELKKIEHLLSKENIVTFNLFERARKEAFFSRLYYLCLSGVHRQNLLGNFGILFATVLRKF